MFVLTNGYRVIGPFDNENDAVIHKANMKLYHEFSLSAISKFFVALVEAPIKYKENQ